MSNPISNERPRIELRIANAHDVERVASGELSADSILSVATHADLDPDVAHLALPEDLLARVGLRATSTVELRGENDLGVPHPMCEGVWLEGNGHEGVFNAIVVPAGTRPIVGASVAADLDLECGF